VDGQVGDERGAQRAPGHGPRVVNHILHGNGGGVRVAKDDAERAALWAGRRGAFGAVAGICSSTREKSNGNDC